jgi:hypothetical protein
MMNSVLAIALLSASAVNGMVFGAPRATLVPSPVFFDFAPLVTAAPVFDAERYELVKREGGLVTQLFGPDNTCGFISSRAGKFWCVVWINLGA